jgi:septal ring factor EnvC (AmiA/AmiB activator)
MLICQICQSSTHDVTGDELSRWGSEHQRQHESERTKRIDSERRRLEDAMAHLSSKLAAAGEELSDSTRAKDAMQRQVKQLTEELAAALQHAEKASWSEETAGVGCRTC